jgi:outer membrane protein TolC
MLYLESARQRNDEATIRYSSGLMTYENWEIVVTDLVNFERSSIRSKRDAVVSEASWEQSIGKTLEE